MNYNNNRVRIIGELKDSFTFDHETHSEKFYGGTVRVMRASGTYDEINVTISERLIMFKRKYCPGETVEIIGEYRSRNVVNEGKSRLILTLFAKEIYLCPDSAPHVNEMTLNGFICKKPIYRTTPFGRHITDMLIAVNRGYNKSAYIPVIAWGRNAVFAKTLGVGDNITLQGRVQSREYEKTLADGTTVTKTTYEVSASEIAVTSEINNERKDVKCT